MPKASDAEIEKKCDHCGKIHLFKNDGRVHLCTLTKDSMTEQEIKETEKFLNFEFSKEEIDDAFKKLAKDWVSA